MTTKTTSIHAALLKARASFKPIQKDAVNPFHKTKYATLDSVLSAVEDALTAEGILIIQSPEMGGDCGVPLLCTRLVHATTGEEIRGLYPLPKTDDPQKLGAAITYARRYSLCPMLGVVADEDDDGNTAKASAPKAPASKPAPKSEPKPKAEPKPADPNDPDLGKPGYTLILDRFKSMCERLGLSDVCDRWVAECGIEYKAHYSDMDHPIPYLLKSFLMSHSVVFEKERPWGVTGMLQSKVNAVTALLDSIELGLSGEGFADEETA